MKLKDTGWILKMNFDIIFEVWKWNLSPEFIKYDFWSLENWECRENVTRQWIVTLFYWMDCRKYALFTIAICICSFHLKEEDVIFRVMFTSCLPSWFYITVSRDLLAICRVKFDHNMEFKTVSFIRFCRSLNRSWNYIIWKIMTRALLFIEIKWLNEKLWPLKDVWFK